MRHPIPRLLLLTVTLLTGFAPAQQSRDWGEMGDLLSRHCGDCHDESTKKGGLDLWALPGGADPQGLWMLAQMRDRVRSGEMPPPDKSELGAAERARLQEWLTAAVLREAPALPPEPGRVTVRRLSRTHYENSIRDLFGVRTAKTAAFPQDDLGYGFDSIGDAVSFSTLHLETYLAAAADVAAQVIDTEDPARPTARRFPGENLALVRGPGFGQDGGHANLYTRAEVGQTVTLPRDGVYELRISCWGDQAGDEPCRMLVRLDDRDLDEIEVPERRATVKKITLPVTGGERRIGLGFVNDFYDPQNPDPKRRDRNLRIEWLEVVGPTDVRQVPAAGAWLPALDAGKGRPAARARPIVRELLLRVFRRPPAQAEIDRLAALVDGAVQRGETFAQGLRLALQAALASPHFLFRIEAGGTEGKAGAPAPLGGHALATRLAYLLWSSTPDAALLERARQGGLDSADAVAAVAGRMLADPRADALATDFAAQWLELRALQERSPDPAAFPGFDDALKAALRRETELLFLAVLREDRDVRDLLDCDFTHVDQRLARFYGIPGGFGADFQRVELPPELRARGGVLGHASIHAITANPTRTSPVKRGKWVLENLLDAPPPPPPPGNDSFTGAEAVGTARGLREQMALHRDKAACRGCHVRMDALGLALEHYDAIGRRRSEDAGGAIDASAELPDGRRIDGLAGLKAALRDDPAFVRALLHKLFVYAVGRAAAPADRVRLWLLAEEFAGRPKVTLRDLVLAIVRLPAFTQRAVGR